MGWVGLLCSCQQVGWVGLGCDSNWLGLVGLRNLDPWPSLSLRPRLGGDPVGMLGAIKWCVNFEFFSTIS